MPGDHMTNLNCHFRSVKILREHLILKLKRLEYIYNLSDLG